MDSGIPVGVSVASVISVVNLLLVSARRRLALGGRLVVTTGAWPVLDDRGQLGLDGFRPKAL